MKLNFPKVIRPLELIEYNESMPGSFQLWVNPPTAMLTEMSSLQDQIRLLQMLPQWREKIAEIDELRKTVKTLAKEDQQTYDRVKALLEKAEEEHVEEKKDEVNDRYLTAFSDLLSQGDKETHVSLQDLKDLMEASFDTDPAFWGWLQNAVIHKIREYRTLVKKV